MLTIDAQIVGQGDQQIDIQVVITAPGGSPGIDSVSVNAIDKSVLDKETPSDCPGFYTFFVREISFSALPIYIEAVECQSGVDQGQAIKIKTSVGPFFREVIGTADCKPPGQNLNNQACIKLQNQIQNLRNTIMMQCADAATIKGQRVAAMALALFFLLSAIACTLAAALAPWPFDLIFAALALLFWVAFGVAAGFANSFQSKLNKLLGTLSQERADLSDLISRLNDVCCPEFVWVPRDVPLC